MIIRVLCIVLIAVTSIATPLSAQEDNCGGKSNNIRFALYFLSKPQDARECAMSVTAGKIAVAPEVSNPAMSCPDMLAWKLFATVIKERFWENWASDNHTFPGIECAPEQKDCQETQPLPVCTEGAATGQCCDPKSASNPGYDDQKNPGKLCPYFPGDHKTAGVAQTPAQDGSPSAPDTPAPPQGMVPPHLHTTNLKQSALEIVFRNKPMFDYIFQNNLYNQEGLAKVFENNDRNIGSKAKTGAPYRVAQTDRAVAEIDFPASAIMIKADWIRKEDATAVQIKENEKYPFVKMTLSGARAAGDERQLPVGEYWLLALHVSSKDTPNWIWATFEHADSLGRCDYTGCNDSYGFVSADTVGEGQAHNFIQPHMSCNQLPQPVWQFAPGQRYDAGKPAPELLAVLAALNIGTADNTSLNPEDTDRAWLSYRLKGTQGNFTDSTGRPTLLGSSVIEGGFASGSSCMTCHARAGVGPGNGPAPLSVFMNEITESGSLPSAKGVPIPDWFHESNNPPALHTLQTDFVWGFVHAKCTKKDC